MNQKVSAEVQTKAQQIANGTKKPGQTKDQTKLIAQGIEKGIAEYKKQHKAKLRQQDKQKKQALKASLASSTTEDDSENQQPTNPKGAFVPWVLLVISWAGFIAYEFVLTK